MQAFRILPAAVAAASLLLAQDVPSHIIVTSRAFPEKRHTYRANLGTQSSQLAHWKEQGAILGFQLLKSSLIDDEGWASMAIVQLGPRGLEQWKRLDQSLSDLVSYETSTPADLIESASAQDAAATPGVHLVIPYEYLVSAAEYKKYAKGYLVPQVNGWIKEGALLSYQLFMARFPAGRSWNALLVLRYRDWNALGQRDAVTAKVRAQLANNPEWKAWSDNKQSFRREKVAVIADPVTEP